MLNDYLEIFLGAYHNFVPEDYALRTYFDSIITVGVLLITVAGVFGVLLLAVSHTLKAARGVVR